MSYGIEVINPSGHVIFSDEVSGLYFVESVDYFSVERSTTWGTTNDAGGATIVRYRTSTLRPIMPFVRLPANTLCAVVRVFIHEGWQYIDVVFSGSAITVPRCTIFSTAMATPASAFGMQAFRADGSVAFDTRLPFMSIKQSLVMPQAALSVSGVLEPAYDNVALVYDQGPLHYYGDRATTRYSLTPTLGASFGAAAVEAPLVFCPSYGIAHKAHTYQFDHIDYWQSVSLPAYNIQSYSWIKSDWALYRAGVGVFGGQIRAGWVPLAGGSYDTATQGVYVNGSQMEWYQNIGSIYAQSGGVSIGNIPYLNSSINLSPTTVILLDGARYP